MARFSVAGRSTVVGTTDRAMASLYATAAVQPRIVEIGVFNTTAVAVAVAVARFTTATNVGAGLTEVPENDPLNVAIATGFAGHTGAGGVGGVVRAASLGAAIGSGIIWTWDDRGLMIPDGTANGVGLITPQGTGQICDYWITWIE